MSIRGPLTPPLWMTPSPCALRRLGIVPQDGRNAIARRWGWGGREAGSSSLASLPRRNDKNSGPPPFLRPEQGVELRCSTDWPAGWPNLGLEIPYGSEREFRH